jgi:hypothetical protein
MEDISVEGKAVETADVDLARKITGLKAGVK